MARDLIGVELARGQLAPAFEHARAMLDPSQQPLPPEVHDLVVRAVAGADESSLRTALEKAREIRYA